MNFCDYGCGKPASFFKPYAKRWCCCKSQNSCPAVIAKQNTPKTIQARKNGVKRKYGVDNISQAQVIKQKKVETCLKNHGVEYPQQSKNVRIKTENTNFERYGVKNPQQNHEVKLKGIVTCLNRFGVKNGSQSTQARNKISEKKLNLDDNAKLLIRTKRENSCIKKYGVRNVSQNETIHYSKMKSSFNKEYVFPSGKTVFLQGYEPIVIDDLIKAGFDEKDIKVGRGNVPPIPYFYEGNSRIYYPDIFIERLNWIIEVKSLYTFRNDLDKNLAKRIATKNSGYSFSFLIR